MTTDGVQNVEDWLNATEGEAFEFKEARQRFAFEDLCKYASALANEDGGRIVLGVTDQRPRRVVGSSAFPQPEDIRNRLNDKIRLRTDVQVIHHPDGRVVAFGIPAHPRGLPVAVEGIAWMRDGDRLKHLSEERRREIYAEVGHDFSADVCPAASWDDLSAEAIESFRRRWMEKAGDETRKTGLMHLDARQLLEDAEAIVDGQVTYAALILFGTRSGLRRHLANAEVVFEYRSSEAAGSPQDRVNFQEGFFLIADQIWQKINQRNDRQHYQEGLFVFDIPTFAERPVRELILNAVSHRDYRLPGSVFIRQYPKRLVCESPGGFPPGISAENVIKRQAPRNRRVSELLERCGLVERSGQGMDLMFEGAVRQSKPLPSFDGTDAYQVVVGLDGQVQDPRFIQFLEKVGRETVDSFSTDHFLVLDLLRREKQVPDALRPALQHLRDLEVVETVGRGRGTRYILSHRLYRFLGKPGHYTRQRGLDREHNLQLLHQHLREVGRQGAPLDELAQVVPTLNKKQIGYRLNLLREQGMATCTGTGRGARWYAVSEREVTRQVAAE